MGVGVDPNNNQEGENPAENTAQFESSSMDQKKESVQRAAEEVLKTDIRARSGRTPENAPAAKLDSEIVSQMQHPFSEDAAYRNVFIFDPHILIKKCEAEFPDEMTCLHIGGVYPTGSDFELDPYTGKPLTRSYANLGDHNLAVGFAAMLLTAPLVPQILTAEEAQDTVARALIHDCTKALEIMRDQAGIDDAYSRESFRESGRILLERERATPQLVKRMVEAGSEWDQEVFIKLFEIREDGNVALKPGHLDLKILMLTDDVARTKRPDLGQESGSVFVTPYERVTIGKWSTLYPFYLVNGVGVKDNQQIVLVSDVKNPEPGVEVLGNYLEMRLYVDTLISRELQLLIDSQDTSAPQQFIKRFLNERAKAFFAKLAE
jgi:hypothetical protein